MFSPDDVDSMIELKHRFATYSISSDEVASVPEDIYRSWVKSRSYYVSVNKALPKLDFSKPYVCRNSVDKVMIETVKELLENFVISSEAHGLRMPYFVLMNNESVIMYGTGSKDTIEQIEHMNIGVNADLSIEIVGTTAHSIAMAEKAFVQMFGSYCYLDVFKGLVMTAAPIVVDGEAIGTLGVINIKVNQEVISSANRRFNHMSFRALSIANAVKREREKHTAELIKATVNLNTAHANNSHGIITLDVKNNIAYICDYAKDLISFNDITKFAHYVPSIENILRNISDNARSKVAITLRDKTKLQAVVTKLKRADSDEVIGYTLYVLKNNEETVRYSLESMIGEHASLNAVKKQVEAIAQTKHNVLILGESGTGKEMIAQAIHEISGVEGHFVAINCASIPANLIESELFGYVEGAFTGALKSGKMGMVEYANNGTLFLDEIGDMPLALQPVLLRVLEERRVTRVGGKQSIPVNVRVIAATNVSLHDKVVKKEFREDLFFRLSVINIRTPALRERGRDVLLLANYFIAKEETVYGDGITLSSEVEELFLNYHWTGNIRQLQNVIISAIYALGGESVIMLKHLPMMYDSEQPKMKNRGQLANMMQETIMEALKSNDWNYAKTARVLGISRTTLYKHMKKMGIER